jgi:hypothetical protein
MTSDRESSVFNLGSSQRVERLSFVIGDRSVQLSQVLYHHPTDGWLPLVDDVVVLAPDSIMTVSFAMVEADAFELLGFDLSSIKTILVNNYQEDRLQAIEDSITIDADGDVGIGVSPLGKLHVKGGVGADTLVILEGGSWSSGRKVTLRFGTAIADDNAIIVTYGNGLRLKTSEGLSLEAVGDVTVYSNNGDVIFSGQGGETGRVSGDGYVKPAAGYKSSDDTTGATQTFVVVDSTGAKWNLTFKDGLFVGRQAG